jgi:hypothetical protein
VKRPLGGARPTPRSSPKARQNNPQAIRFRSDSNFNGLLDVENFGPFLVESDFTGASLFERENAKIAPNIAKLYAGTKPATMRRYGETDDKTEDVIGSGDAE